MEWQRSKGQVTICPQWENHGFVLNILKKNFQLKEKSPYSHLCTLVLWSFLNLYCSNAYFNTFSKHHETVTSLKSPQTPVLTFPRTEEALTKATLSALSYQSIHAKTLWSFMAMSFCQIYLCEEKTGQNIILLWQSSAYFITKPFLLLLMRYSKRDKLSSQLLCFQGKKRAKIGRLKVQNQIKTQHVSWHKIWSKKRVVWERIVK